MGIEKGKRPKTPPPESPEVKALTTVVEEDLSINGMLRLAVDKLRAGEDATGIVTAMEKLVELEDRVSRREAEKEFINALSKFQQECPAIPKIRTVDYVSDGGTRTNYKFAPIQDIMKVVAPILYPLGFALSWDTETIQTDNRFILKAYACLMHRNGHSIKSKFSIPVPEKIAKMAETHRHCTTKTFAIRNCIVDLLGIVTADEDTDGMSPETIDEKTIKVLKGKLKRKGADEKAFFEYMDVKDYAEIRNVDLNKAALALDMYEAKEKPPEKTFKKETTTTKKKAAPAPATENLNTLRTRAHTKLNEAINIKAEGYKPPTRSQWEPLINNAKTADEIDRLISNLTAFIDEAGSDGKLKL